MKKIFICLTLIMFIVTNFSTVQAIEANDTVKYMNIEWWQKYNDEYLTDNLVKLYQNNYDLKNAALKVKENEQIVKMQFANQLPQVSIDGNLSRTMRSSMQQFGANFQVPNFAQYNYYLPLTMAYEVDIWGTNRYKTKSQKEQLEIIKELERATYIALSSDFAVDYFNLIKTDELISIQNELIKTQEEIISKVSDKYEGGLCTVNELLAEKNILTALNEEMNNLLKTQEVLINSLKVYLADSNAEIQRGTFEQISLLKDIPQEYASSVIENRPDFKQEEANIRRIGFDVKVAKREFFPKFIVYGQIGLNAYHFDNLFNRPSQLFNAGVMPSIDLFSGGRKKAMLKFKKFEYETALNSYQNSILNGVKELNNGLAEYKTANNNYNESKNRLELQTKTFNLVQDKKDIGTASELDVLYSKEALYAVKKVEVSNKINSLISTIGLYKATGGMDLYRIQVTIQDNNSCNFNARFIAGLQKII